MSKNYSINKAECLAADLDPAKVEAIAKRLARVATNADKMGFLIFTGINGKCDLRYRYPEEEGKGLLICAEIHTGSWDAGDGTNTPGDDGLMRGEF